MLLKLIVVVCVYFVADGLFRGVDGIYAASAFPTLWKQTIDIADRYPCEKPQARVFKAVDLLTRLDKGDVVTPHTVVLHRCDKRSGCCASAHETCWPLSTNRVDFVFVVHSAPMKLRYETHAAVNHTKCTCNEVEVSTVHPAPWVR